MSDVMKEGTTEHLAQDAMLVSVLRHLCNLCYERSASKGFWTGPENDNVPTKLCLIHSEISEALETFRKGSPPSEKIPPITNFAEELADAVIRIGDLCGRLGIDLGDAIVKKLSYNATRPHMHGGKRC